SGNAIAAHPFIHPKMRHRRKVFTGPDLRKRPLRNQLDGIDLSIEAMSRSDLEYDRLVRAART
ncbi:hypothetical protein ACWGDS_39215, partial [Streptomyces sp. NPDC055059]